MRRFRRMYISLKTLIIVLWSFQIKLVLSKGPRIQFLSAHATMEAHIVGGVPIDLELCPSAVLIYNLGSMCAGSILNSYSIISAAHCFDHNTDVDEISVHVGKYNFLILTLEYTKIQIFKYILQPKPPHCERRVVLSSGTYKAGRWWWFVIIYEIYTGLFRYQELTLR